MIPGWLATPAITVGAEVPDADVPQPKTPIELDVLVLEIEPQLNSSETSL
jgi:hypothetical protein